MGFLLKAIVLAFAAFAMNASASNLNGLWQTAPNKDTGAFLHVEIAACEEKPDSYCGLITAYFLNGQSEERDMVGKLIIKNMKETSATTWKNRTIWAPDDNKTYKSKMVLLNQDTLKVSGCVFGRLICKIRYLMSQSVYDFI